MAYSNDPQPNPYAGIPSPLPNIDFPLPYWINKLADFIIIACLDPDLAYGALLVPAALKMLWSVATPSTKQVIEAATGASWICGTKQVLGQAQAGEEIAASDTGRFVYGLAKGLDIASYYAFMISTGAEGVIDYGSFAQRFHRVCAGDNSQYRGLVADGGWPTPSITWASGPSYFNSVGNLIGPSLIIQPGQIGAYIAWCSFTSLFGTGGVITSMRIRDEISGQVFDVDTVNNLFSVGNKAVVQFFTTEGRAVQKMELLLEVFFDESVSSRVVCAEGGCYKRAWYPGDEDAPPYWNMKTMLKGSKG